jgi:hypothetical protein
MSSIVLMTAEDAPDHFSWEEIYSLYGIPVFDVIIPGSVGAAVASLDEEPSSPGEVGIGPFPPTNPMEAFSN